MPIKIHTEAKHEFGGKKTKGGLMKRGEVSFILHRLEALGAGKLRSALNEFWIG